MKKGGVPIFSFQSLLTEPKTVTEPKELFLKEISAVEACQLNAAWHSRLPRIHWGNVVRNTHYVCYAIYSGNLPVGVAIWSSPVAQNRFKDGKKLLELRRLALSAKCPKNTASWCISKMVKLIRNKFPELSRLISYQDASVHSGKIYAASNWHIASECGFESWSNKRRKRNAEQATGRKIRWEYNLN